MARDYAKPRHPNANRNRGNGNGQPGNRRGSSSGGGGSSGRDLPGWVWLVVGLAIGLVVAAFVYIDRPSHRTALGEGAASSAAAAGPAASAKDRDAGKSDDAGKGEAKGGDRKDTAAADKPAPKEPVKDSAAAGSGAVAVPDKVPSRYSFYNELPKIEVTIPREYSRPAPVGKPPKAPPPDVKQALADPGGAYLVQVGAYKSRDEADKQRASLALIGYESRIEQVTLTERDTRFRVRIGPQPTLAAAQSVLARLESNKIKGFLVKIKD